MAESVVLKTDGKVPLQATFLPEHGMRLVNYRWGEHSVVEEGRPIGPHYGEKNPKILSPNGLNSAGEDAYPCGLGRYAPWKWEQRGEGHLTATLSGKELWKEVAIQEYEGQPFAMKMDALLDANGLHIAMNIVSDADSVIGYELHFPVVGLQEIRSEVQKEVYREGKRNDWKEVGLPIDQSYHSAFRPLHHPLEGIVILDKGAYKIKTLYTSCSEENAWVLRRSKESPTLSIAPVSAQNPWRPNLTVSSIRISLSVL